MIAIELVGLMTVAQDDGLAPIPGATLIRVRDLGAVVRPAANGTHDGEVADTTAYEQLLDCLFAQGAVFPAPPGLVFRSSDVLRAWMEQNYVGLAEGLTFLSGRCEARVHVRSTGHGMSAEDVAAATLEATDAIRALRHFAVATVTLSDPEAPVLLSVAFLVKANEWTAFGEAVLAQERRYTALRFEMTGPWIPYDFVRLDLGV